MNSDPHPLITPSPLHAPQRPDTESPRPDIKLPIMTEQQNNPQRSIFAKYLCMFHDCSSSRRFRKSDTLTVLVGRDGNVEEFTAYKSYLTKSSEFFRAAMNRDWKEAQENSVTIQDHEPETFDAYLGWLYSANISLDKDKCQLCLKLKSASGSPCNKVHSLELARMYVLGDYLSDKHFRNAVIDLMKKGALASDCYLPASTVQYIWNRTTSGDPLRKSMLEIFKTDLLYPERLQAWLNALHKDILVDFLVSISDSIIETGPLDPSGSAELLRVEHSFHAQSDDGQCCAPP